MLPGSNGTSQQQHGSNTFSCRLLEHKGSGACTRMMEMLSRSYCDVRRAAGIMSSSLWIQGASLSQLLLNVLLCCCLPLVLHLPIDSPYSLCSGSLTFVSCEASCSKLECDLLHLLMQTPGVMFRGGCNHVSTTTLFFVRYDTVSHRVVVMTSSSLNQGDSCQKEVSSPWVVCTWNAAAPHMLPSGQCPPSNGLVRNGSPVSKAARRHYQKPDSNCLRAACV
jgi:hypothetical protein